MMFDVGDQVAGGRFTDGRIEALPDRKLFKVLLHAPDGIAERAANALA